MEPQLSTEPAKPYGEANAASKLTADLVRTIRQRHTEGVSLRELGDDYDVSAHTIWLCVQRRTWKHVD